MDRDDLYWCTVDPPGGGVYVYIKDGKVWYVGKTNNLQRRICGHHVITYGHVRNIISRVPSCGLYIYPCNDPLMSFLEDYLIWVYRPPENTAIPPLVRFGASPLYDLAVLALEELEELCKRHPPKMATRTAQSST